MKERKEGKKGKKERKERKERMSCPFAGILLAARTEGKGLMELKGKRRELGEVLERPSVNVMSCHLRQWCLQSPPFLQLQKHETRILQFLQKQGSLVTTMTMTVKQQQWMTMAIAQWPCSLGPQKQSPEKTRSKTIVVLHSWNVLSLLRQSVRSSAEWIIHQDHSQRVTAAVHCHLSHCKPLFIFIWAQERWARQLQQLSWWILMLDTAGPDTENRCCNKTRPCEKLKKLAKKWLDVFNISSRWRVTLVSGLSDGRVRITLCRDFLHKSTHFHETWSAPASTFSRNPHIFNMIWSVVGDPEVF